MGKRHQFLTLSLQGWAYGIHPCINSDGHWYLLSIFLSLVLVTLVLKRMLELLKLSRPTSTVTQAILRNPNDPPLDEAGYNYHTPSGLAQA